MRTTKLFKTTTVLLGVLALMVIAAPAALAQSSSERGYEGESPLGEIEAVGPQEGGDESPPAAQVVSGGSDEGGDALPFTGWDVGIVAALGLALAGTGLLVRRAARSPGD